MLRRNLQPARSCRGATMIEVLVTFLIVTLGLLGAAGMQSRLQIAELESYQRAQAIILLQDMVDRINANRRNVASYVTADPVGTGNTSLACSAPATTAARDLCEWHQALQGSTETSSGNPVGAMIGARGCVELAVAAMPREAAVAPASTTCGSTAFTQANARRAMIARVKIGCLQNDPTTGVCVTP